MKTFLAFVFAVVTLSAHATLQFGWTNGVNATFANGGVVPDDSEAGSPWTDTRTLTGLSGTIQDVSVNLHLTGGWNGDLYAYVVHGSGFTVLLNLVGTPGAEFGYSDPGMQVKLTDSAVTSIHNYGGAGIPTGNWKPDDANGFGLFMGLDPNGAWSLYIEDMSGGSMTTVTSWGLDLNIVAVPEVETWVAAALAGLFGAFWLNRQIWGPKRA
jgi:hypothetical protein